MLPLEPLLKEKAAFSYQCIQKEIWYKGQAGFEVIKPSREKEADRCLEAREQDVYSLDDVKSA
jgi:hypothetical protein